jgi:hypothetical protein
MDAHSIVLDRVKARELYQQYKAHQHYSTPVDQEIQRAYQLLAQGRLVIKAIESIKAAGLKTDGVDAGFPKLALARADAPCCKVSLSHDGSGYMYAGDVEPRSRGWRKGGGLINSRNCFTFPKGTFKAAKEHRWHGEAVMPMVPLHLRPKRGLANYHVLFEAEWSKIAPVDPFLLRRIGRADLWVVVTMWELSEIERAVLSTRIT